MDKHSIDVPRALPKDECESAKILINEGLIEEAKRLLFRVLAHTPNFSPAQKLLKQIEDRELKEIFNSASGSASAKKQTSLEDIEQLIENLNHDLDLEIESTGGIFAQERFQPVTGLSSRELLDLGIGYMEMECYSDALREFKKAEKKIRIEDSFLGETGLAVVSLIAQCLTALGKAYEAKAFLEPVLVEPDLKHEDKALLYYEMGCAEQALEQPRVAANWFKKVMAIDSQFKDTAYRLKLVQQKK